MKRQYITDREGKKTGVILSIKEYEKLVAEREDDEDVRLYDEVKARNEKSIPFDKYLKKRQSRKNG